MQRVPHHSAVLVPVFLVFASSTALGAWPSDPAVNLGIAVTVGDQNQAKIVPTSDGGVYISWFGNPGGGYDVYLQRVSAQGVPQWSAATTLIADRSFSSTQDYGLDVDGSDHAVMSFRDDRFGGIQVTATRVSPAGVQDWGPMGVQLTATTDSIASPHIAALHDGRIAVGWSQASNSRIDILNASGQSVLGRQIVLSDSPGTATISVTDLRASDQTGVTNGNFVALWVRQSGSTRQLHTRAFTSSGATAWNLGAIFSTGSIQFGNFPTCVSDGAGGAVYCWYQTSPLQCFAQWIDNTGAARYPAGGLPLSTNATRIRVSPSIDFNTVSHEAFAFWTEQNSLQSQNGLYGQRVSPTGQRLWTDDGLQIIPLSSVPITQVRSLLFSSAETGAAVFYSEDLAFGNQRLHGARLNAAGSHLWSPSLIDVCSVSSSKARLFAARSISGFAILAWSDGRNDSGDIYAQNVNSNGSLGSAADLNHDGVVNTLDLGIELAAWSIPATAPGCGGALPCPADINLDGFVNTLDLGILLSGWTL